MVKRYLADMLTFARFVLATFIMILVVKGGSAECALILFALGELTDAFDGTCAKKWPFPKGKEPSYRKYAEKYDIVTDTYLILATAFFAIIRLRLWYLAILAVVIGVIIMVIELIAYGKLVGHPNDCRPGSLYRKNPQLAEKVLLSRRRVFYLPSIAILVVAILIKTAWALWIKCALAGLAVLVGGFLWVFLKARRKKVARD